MLEPSLKKMLLFLALICLSSGLLQVLVINKRRSLHTSRYPDSRNHLSHPNPTPASLEGEVTALGGESLHLRKADGKLESVRCDHPDQFQVGQRLRVEYLKDSSPMVPRITILPP